MNSLNKSIISRERTMRKTKKSAT